MIKKIDKIGFWVLFLLTFTIGNAESQSNTIGLLEIDSILVSDGYVLFNPENQSTVFLINNCGEVVHTWKTDEFRLPGKEQYIDEAGRLYLASIQPALQNPSFGSGGAGGVLEILDWEGNIEWQRIVADGQQRQHHDIHIMPNGNIMYIAWENIPLDKAAECGFDTLNNPQIGFWPDKIVEINPNTDQIVWEWRSMDHMIQDIDSERMNYGVIAEHPERININYIDFAFGRQDVHHINAIDYNEELDMVMISVRNFNEIWIIDHSTTIEEAASHDGGLRGKGGDLIYRWGNPAAYNSGEESDQKLFRQHDAAWIDDVPQNHPYFGQVSVYNNFIGPEFSLGTVFNPVFNADENSFASESGLYLPLDFTTTFSHPVQAKTFSTAASNIQMLPNGNVLMCAARQGRMFELTISGDLTWEYLIPTRNGLPIMQGEEIQLSDNFTFSGRRYAIDFNGFQGRDLTPKGFIELNPNTEVCSISLGLNGTNENNYQVYPNPVKDILTINIDRKSKLRITDLFGNVLLQETVNQGETHFNLEHLPSGFYFVENNIYTEKVKIIKL